MALPRFWRLHLSPPKLSDKLKDADEPLAEPPAQPLDVLCPGPPNPVHHHTPGHVLEAGYSACHCLKRPAPLPSPAPAAPPEATARLSDSSRTPVPPRDLTPSPIAPDAAWSTTPPEPRAATTASSPLVTATSSRVPVLLLDIRCHSPYVRAVRVTPSPLSLSPLSRRPRHPRPAVASPPIALARARVSAPPARAHPTLARSSARTTRTSPRLTVLPLAAVLARTHCRCSARRLPRLAAPHAVPSPRPPLRGRAPPRPPSPLLCQAPPDSPRSSAALLARAQRRCRPRLRPARAGGPCHCARLRPQLPPPPPRPLAGRRPGSASAREPAHPSAPQRPNRVLPAGQCPYGLCPIAQPLRT
nr:proline-rich receptor-like protein kinase PERK2 [Aegilops tauschii subsp. strangulata]